MLPSRDIAVPSESQSGILTASAALTHRMMSSIEGDHGRFKEIVKGKVRKNLKKFISHGELIGRKGKDLVSIPVPEIEIPHFKHGKRGGSGVGQGEGEEGDPVGDPQEGGGQGAGEDPAEHLLEVGITLDELADILGEELKLPNLEPKGNDRIVEIHRKYTGRRKTGSRSNRIPKHTLLDAIKRQIQSGEYNANDPDIQPIPPDEWYRSDKETHKPHFNAAIIYLMDVSGSMTDEAKEIVRTEAKWLDLWIQKFYEGVEVRYIIHDARAKLVDEETFYHTRESGGTKVSSAYELCAKTIQEQFPPMDWNIYVFHFTDGDNWGEDNPAALKSLQENILPYVNLFGYGQVETDYGGGEFMDVLKNGAIDSEFLRTSSIRGRDDIYDSLKELLG